MKWNLINECALVEIKMLYWYFKVINTQMCICDEEGIFMLAKTLQITPMCIVFVGESLQLF